MPIITTIKNFRATGDQLFRVEGVLSDTMSVIFNGVNRGKPFSEAVKEAMDQGYTEAELKDDLSGFDTARKVCYSLCLLSANCAVFVDTSDMM